MELVGAGAAGNALQSYGPDGFRVSGTDHPHAILLTADFIAPLQGDALTLASLQPLLEQTPPIEVLILGTGREMVPIDPLLRAALRQRGISADAMDTGAACRTYAVLHSEGRRVGAALLLP